MINNSVNLNRRLVLSAKHLSSFQNDQKENRESNDIGDIDNLETESYFNDDNSNYILGYN
jgi:hypothetical protein